MRTAGETLWCSNGANCVAYSALGEPSKLSRGNPGTRCFACEKRSTASELKAASPKKKVVKHKTNEPRQSTTNGVEEHVGRKHAEVEHAHEVLERRRQSVRTCKRGLHSAQASGDKRLVRRWSRALKDAEARLAWAEADFEKARSATR
jgi:hypothetical protein